MPCTTVQKITGAIIILMSEMKPSPSGFSAVPVFGKKCPIAMPMAMAISTCTYRTVYQGRRGARSINSPGDLRCDVCVPAVLVGHQRNPGVAHDLDRRQDVFRP